MYPAHDRYWDIHQDKSVRIASPVGQAQFMLTDYLSMADAHPKEWMLLCRFADTISIADGQMELRQLRRLAEHLKRSVANPRRSDIDPVVATEVEKEIILRTAPYYAEGLGHDIIPAARMLKDYERKDPVFTQAERNLILRYAYFVGDASGTEQLAGRIAAHNISDREIAAVCASIETVDLGWSGLDQIEGLEADVAEGPTFRFSFENCEDPMKFYPRFAFYPVTVPEDAVLLQSGVILQACPDDMERWQSSLLNIDQTYTAPRYYIQTGHNRYELAERVDEAHDLEALLSGEDMLPSSTPAKPSVRGLLREAAQEISQRPPPENKSKGGDAR